MTINVTNQHESEPLATELINLFATAQGWKARTGQLSPAPAARSSLAGDDRVTEPYLMSPAVASLLISAVDNFHAVHALLAGARIIHTSAPFTLLRAALENSSIAVYLLAPTSRHERVERRLRLQWAEFVDAENARGAMDQADPDRQEERRRKVLAVGLAAGLPQPALSRLTANPQGYAQLVSIAGRATFGEKAGALATVAWMADSGVAHGRTWAGLSLSDKQQVEPTRAGMANMRLTGSQSTILQHAQVASMMIQRGWSLFDQRRACHMQ